MEHERKRTLYLLAPLLFCITSSCSLLWRNNNNKETEGASHADSCVIWVLDRGISHAWALRSDSARFSFLSFLNVMFSLNILNITTLPFLYTFLHTTLYFDVCDGKDNAHQSDVDFELSYHKHIWRHNKQFSDYVNVIDNLTWKQDYYSFYFWDKIPLCGSGCFWISDSCFVLWSARGIVIHQHACLT